MSYYGPELPENVEPLGNDVFMNRLVDKADNWVAIHEFHRTPDGEWCSGFVAFDVPSDYLTGREPKWQVESFDPLTLSPSLLCRACGHHGFIREGRWVPA